MIVSLHRDLPFKQAAAATAQESAAEFSAAFLISHQQLGRLNQHAAVAAMQSEQKQANADAAHAQVGAAQEAAVEAQLLASEAQAEADAAQVAATTAQAAAAAAQARASSAQVRTASAQADAAAAQTRAMDAQVQAVDAHVHLVETKQQLALQQGVMAAGCYEKQSLRMNELAVEADLQQVLWALKTAEKMVAASPSMLPLLFTLTLGLIIAQFVDLAMLEVSARWISYLARTWFDLLFR